MFSWSVLETARLLFLRSVCSHFNFSVSSLVFPVLFRKGPGPASCLSLIMPQSGVIH